MSNQAQQQFGLTEEEFTDDYLRVRVHGEAGVNALVKAMRDSRKANEYEGYQMVWAEDETENPAYLRVSWSEPQDLPLVRKALKSGDPELFELVPKAAKK